MSGFKKDIQYYKFSAYGFLKNLRFFDAFFILFLVDKGLPYSQIGILYAVREITINLFELPSGILADTYGRKASLAASLIAYIFSFIVFYISGSFYLFLIAFVLFGIADAFRSGTHKGMIMDYLKINGWQDEKIKYYGHTRSWSQTGSAISSLAGGVIVFLSANYSSVFIYSVVPYVLNLLLIMSYPDSLNSRIKKKNRGAGLVTAVKMFFKTVKDPKILKLIYTSANHTAYLKVVKDYIQPVMVNVTMMIPLFMALQKDQKSGLFVGLFYFIIYLLSSRASYYSSRITGRYKKGVIKLTLFLGFGSGALAGAFYFKEMWMLSLITFAGIYIAENIRKPALTGFVADNTPNEILTSVISAQSLLKTILTSVFALVFGFIAQYSGIGVALFAVSAVLLLISVVFRMKR